MLKASAVRKIIFCRFGEAGSQILSTADVMEVTGAEVEVLHFCSFRQ